VRTDELVAAERQVRQWLKDGAIINPPLAATSEAPEVLVPKSIVLYMIGTKPEHYIDLVDSLTALNRYYLSRWGYGVLVMHEGLTLTQMQRLSDIYPLTSFYLLNLTFPPHINASSVSYQVAGHASVGYRHMCRFYSGSIFTSDVMLQYDWCCCALTGFNLLLSCTSSSRYWRVDSDSFLLGPLQHDPIRELADTGSIYGYMALGREDEYLTTGLWAATQKHMKERRVRPTYLKQVLHHFAHISHPHIFMLLALPSTDPFRSSLPSPMALGTAAITTQTSRLYICHFSGGSSIKAFSKILTQPMVSTLTDGGTRPSGCWDWPCMRSRSK
jgi:hypothetical protein